MNIPHQILKVGTVATSLVFHLGAIVIDGIHRVSQNLSNLRTVGKSQANEREYSQLGVEQLIGFQHYLLIILQQGIEFRHKVVPSLTQSNRQHP